MKSLFKKYFLINLLLLLSQWGGAYEIPFFKTVTVSLEGNCVLYLDFLYQGQELLPKERPQLIGKESGEGESHFRFRFRKEGVYQLRFQNQDHSSGKLTHFQKEVVVQGSSSP